ncbi:hypothetical protein PR048_013617 [Dryococelus australis]|uniref:Uncharacterized protein n=1 Tax=Dryococelus australis TaxID=614101 RepID=A0ABQ9HSN7_9NEOP|nr:hypothetical protein PR048_013617 [Dryococelus australis]
MKCPSPFDKKEELLCQFSQYKRAFRHGMIVDAGTSGVSIVQTATLFSCIFPRLVKVGREWRGKNWGNHHQEATQHGCMEDNNVE